MRRTRAVDESLPQRPRTTDDSHAIARMLELLGLVHFPGMVAVVMVLPVVSVGPLAFAIREDIPLSQSDIGTTFATFFLASALVSGFGGPIVSRLGVTNIVRLGLFGAALVAATLALSATRLTVYAASLVGGVLNGITAVAVSLTIMSQVPSHRRGLAFGLRTAGLPSAAAVAGLGAFLIAGDHLSWRCFMWIVSGAAIAAALSIRTGSGAVVNPIQHTAQAVARPGRHRTLWMLGAAGLLGSTGTAVVTPFLVEGLIAQGQSPGRAASVLALAGWFGILSRVVVGALSDRVPDPLMHLRASALLLVVLSVSMIFLAFGRGAFLLIGATLMALGLGLAWPGLLLFAALATHQSFAATAAGHMQFGQHSGAVLGPLCFGLIVAHYSFSSAWLASSVTLLCASLLLFLAARALKHPQLAVLS